MALDEAEEDYGEEGNDEFAALAAEAFPDQEWSPPRLSALKALIHLCVNGGEDEEEDAPEEDGPKRGKPALELVFGIGKPEKG